MPRATCLCASAMLALAGTSTDATAQDRLNTLLLIDITNPSQVLVQATGEAPEFEHTGTSMRQGVVIVEFFDEPYPFGSIGPPILESTLRPWSAEQTYIQMDNDFGAVSPTCMALYVELPTLPDDQDFLITTPAFVGEMRLGLTDAVLPVPGTRGPIVVGPFSPGEAPIGEWFVIPTPGAAALLAFACIAPVRRRR